MATTSKTTAKAVAAKPKAPVAKKAPAAKKAAAPAVKKAKVASVAVPHDQRRHYVEMAAYYIAERRGFHGGSELDDWVQAEVEVDRMLREGLLGL